jgi:endonuclease/exonuclease/phosphatase (EEP) superfamily protein YafD
MARIQVAMMQLALFIVSFFVIDFDTNLTVSTQIILFLFMIYNASVLLPFTPLYKKFNIEEIPRGSTSISMISVNVYQFNKEPERLITLVKKEKPDILLTIESDKVWEQALEVLEKGYPHTVKVPQDNTYVMHVYSKIPFKKRKVNYFVAKDLPSIELEMETEDTKSFKIYGIHPPPPSPTEEKNSKERDGDLLSIAKKIQDEDIPTIVIGDFNNVAWAKSSRLFKKTSGLIDPRVGRGLVSTFHADYPLFRLPIDLTYHSTDIFIEELKTMPPIGSDHLPLFCKFFINKHEHEQDELAENLEEDEPEQVEEIIEDGIDEKSEERANP